MNKLWTNIKAAAPRVWRMAFCVLAIVNAYSGQTLGVVTFLCLFGLDILNDGLIDLAMAIRTQRNFHVIGDGNEISMAGASLYAGHVTVTDRASTVRKMEQ